MLFSVKNAFTFSVKKPEGFFNAKKSIFDFTFSVKKAFGFFNAKKYVGCNKLVLV